MTRDDEVRLLTAIADDAMTVHAEKAIAGMAQFVTDLGLIPTGVRVMRRGSSPPPPSLRAAADRDK